MPSNPPFEELAREACGQLASLRDFVRWGASRFNAGGLCFGHGYPGAIDEAAALVLHALHLDPEPPAEVWGARLTGRERRAVLALFQRRIEERVPAAYLIGHAWFAGMRFRVDPRVPVPRSPLAEWIDRGFKPWPSVAGDDLSGPEPPAGEIDAVLDLGTGSGCIAIACASALPAARVDAVDVDREALALARENVRDHALEGRVRLVESDLFTRIDGVYDLIVSNPPYVGRSEYESLPAEYRHEPASALRAGETGIDCIERILGGCAAHLGESGVLVVEAGTCRPALEARYPELPFTWLDLERGGENVFLLRRDQLG